MSTNNIKIFDMALMAEASYVEFDEIADYSNGSVASALISSDQQGHFTQQQADYFIANWKVVAHKANTDTGFSATVFKSQQDSSIFVYAVRGTEQPIEDLLEADYGDIVKDGLAINQIIDMYNDVSRLKAGTGENYDVAFLETLAR